MRALMHNQVFNFKTQKDQKLGFSRIIDSVKYARSVKLFVIYLTCGVVGNACS